MTLLTLPAGPHALADAPPWRWGDLRWPLAITLCAHLLLWQVLHPAPDSVRGQPRPSAIKVMVKTLAPALAPAWVPPVPASMVTPAPVAVPEPAAKPALAAPSPVPMGAPTPLAPRPPQPRPAAPVPSTGVGPSGTRLQIEGLTPERERAILAMVPESYLPIDELDKTPELLGEWQVNDAVVPQGKDRPDEITVTVRLWVSDQGHIDAYQVLNVQPLVPWVDELLKPLDLSTLRPALKNGDPVASSWTIEFTLDFTGGPWAPKVPKVREQP